MYEKMIAVTNRNLIRESNENEKINAGTDWSEAYIKQLAYVASLHLKAMVLREKDLTEEKYEELAKAVIRLCEKEGTTLILHRFPEVVKHLGYDKLHLPLEMLKAMGRTDGLNLLGTSVHSVEDALLWINAGVSVVQLDKFTVLQVAYLAEYCQSHNKLTTLAVAGGVNRDNLAEYIKVGANLIVTSSPYHAQPMDVQVRFLTK